MSKGWLECWYPPPPGAAQDAGRLSAASQGCGKSCKTWCARGFEGRGVGTAGWLLSEPGHDGNLSSANN